MHKEFNFNKNEGCTTLKDRSGEGLVLFYLFGFAFAAS